MLAKQISEILPYFQPIYSANTNSIYAYEVLGRFVDDDGCVQSLGPLFNDAHVGSTDLLVIDQQVRQKALRIFGDYPADTYIFFNMRLEWMAQYADHLEHLPTIIWAEQYGIDPKRLVIEITEEEYDINNQTYVAVLQQYKKYGCRIAIDDYGDKANDLHRLASIAPDILKINMYYVQGSSKSNYYREYIKSLSNFADKMGIEVLYEGIENQAQLDCCLAARGRFFQGFYLSKPLPSLEKANGFSTQLLESSKAYINKLYTTSKRINKIVSSMNRFLAYYTKNNPFIPGRTDINSFLLTACLQMPLKIRQAYICDRYGYQLSYNVEFKRGNYNDVVCKDYRNYNWAWRAYFQEAIMAIGAGQTSYLSKIYLDAITKEKIRTYIFPVNKNTLLFADFSFEEECQNW